MTTEMWITSIFRRPGTGPKINETLDTLTERVKSASSSEDKRKAISELKKIFIDSKYIQVVGRLIEVFLDFIKTERQDATGISEVLEICYYLTRWPDNIADRSVYTQNLDFLLKDKEFLTILFQLLGETDKVKFQTIRVLEVLVAYKLTEIQEAMIQAAVIPNIVDLLKSPNMIRNEVLLLLKELARNNSNIQTIISFAKAFPQLIEIMNDEQMGNGGIVVQDCLHVLNNLLQDNPITINSFREEGEIPKFCPLLELEQSDVFLITEDKTEIILLALETVNLLVSGPNPQDVYSSQTVLKRSGVLDKVLKLGLGGINSPAIRSKALWTLGHMIRGHSDNCSHFRDSQFAPVTQQKPQHSVLRLLSITFTSKVYKERRASLHTLQCYLHGNEVAQLALASTVTPPPDENPNSSEETVGRILLKHLNNWETDEDNLRPWYACIMLSYILHENKSAKELLLKRQLDIPKQHGTTENLFTKITRELIKAIKTKADTQIQVGMLRLLSVWITDCPQAAQIFLQTPSHTQFLIEIITQRSNMHVTGLSSLLLGLSLLSDTSDAGSGIYNLIAQKVGVEKYHDCLNQLVKSEDFINAEQGKFHMHTEENNKLMFYDYEYTLFFQRANQQIINKMKPVTQEKPQQIPASNRDQQVIKYYQDLLEKSDQKIKQYEGTINQLRLELLSGNNNNPGSQSTAQQGIISDLQNKVSNMEKEIVTQREKINALSSKIKELKESKSNLKAKMQIQIKENVNLKNTILQLQDQISTNEITNNTNLNILHSRMEQLQRENEEKTQEQDDLYVAIAEKTLEIKAYKKQLGIPIDSDAENDEEV